VPQNEPISESAETARILDAGEEATGLNSHARRCPAERACPSRVWPVSQLSDPDGTLRPCVNPAP